MPGWAPTLINEIPNLKNIIQEIDAVIIQIGTNRLSAEEPADVLGKADMFLPPMSFVSFH